MTNPKDLDVEYYDHIDGEPVGPMPLHDAEKMVALLRDRMTPENLWSLTNGLKAHLDAKQTA